MFVRAFAVYMALTAVVTSEVAASCEQPGDVSGDATTDILDVQCSVITTLWVLSDDGSSAPDCLAPSGLEAANTDCAGSVNVTDTILVIQLVLGAELAETIDADANGCPDTCELLDGECNAAADCDSGQYCSGSSEGGPGACMDKGEAGAPCTAAEECSSAVCGPDNDCLTACDSDDDCPDELFFCQPDSGGCDFGKANGTFCTGDDQCNSGICDLTCTECVVGKGCGEGEYCNVVVGGTNSCQPQKGLGEGCSLDTECESFICDLACVECVAGTFPEGCSSDEYCDSEFLGSGNACKPKKPNGEGCTVGSQCESGVCDLTCTECTVLKGCDDDEYCDATLFGVNSCQPKKSNGDGCVLDSECDSNICDFACTECTVAKGCSSSQYCNVVVFGSNSCQPKKGNGSGCTVSSECSSGICDFTCTACTNSSHCSSNQYCLVIPFGTNSCKSKKGKGSACGSNQECQSNNCFFFSCQ